MDMGKRINSKLNKLFKFSGMTQREVAGLANVSQTTVNEYFGGNANITKKNFINILKALDVDLESVIDAKLKKMLKDDQNESSLKMAADISVILNHLEKPHKLAVLSTVINLSKMKSENNHKISEAIDRLEKTQLR